MGAAAVQSTVADVRTDRTTGVGHPAEAHIITALKWFGPQTDQPR